MYRDLKLNALRLRRGTCGKAALYALPALLAGGGAAVSFLLAGLCLVFSPDAVFAAYPLYDRAAALVPAGAFPAALIAAGLFFLVAAADFAFCFRAVFLHAADRDGRRPRSLLSFRVGCRALYCALRLFFTRAGMLLILCAPAALTAAAGILLLQKRGMTPGLLLLTAAVGTVQLLTGLLVWAVLRERHAMTWFLLYQNPLLTGREAIRSGVLLTDGQLAAAALAAARTLPWLLTAPLLIPLPFAVTYRQTQRALICKKIYGENRRVPVSPAVTFYISSRSSFRARRDPCEAPTDNPTL